MNTRCFIAGLALSTGCALLVMSQRAGADVFLFDEPDPAHRRLARLDPNRVTPKYSTLGAGMEYRIPFRNGTRLRFEQYTRDYQQTTGRDFYNYKIRGRLNSQNFALDWHPFEGRFRTSAGVFVNRFDVSASGGTSGSLGYNFAITKDELAALAAQPQVQQYLSMADQYLRDHGIDKNATNTLNTATSQFQGYSTSGTIDYTSAVNANARVTWNRFAPYLGFGWTNTTRSTGLFYSIDIGAMYIGRPHVDLDVSGPLVDQINRVYSAELQAYVEEERKTLENKLSKYRVLPVVSVGVSYRF